MENLTDKNISEQLIEIEMALDNQQKEIDDLSDMVVRQGKQIDFLIKQNQMLKDALSQDIVKPLSEETPPPHY